jgi:hypothetical protein
MEQAKVGLQGDCSLPLFDEDVVITGTDEILWYGARGRRNAFTVTYFGPAETPPTPLCPQQVADLLIEIRSYIVAVEQAPDTEFLNSR